MEDFSSLLGGGGGGSGGGGGGSGKSESSSASATSGNNFGGGLSDGGSITPLGIIVLGALGLFGFLVLVLIARK
jgi:hypothetical protein